MRSDKIADELWEVPAHSLTEFHSRRSKYCTLICVLNEGERIQKQLRKMLSINCPDIILVDGQSNDGSLNLDWIAQAGVRTFMCNKSHERGLSAQMRIGLAYAMRQGYAGVVCIDGNNKDNPEAIPLFTQALENNFDHVQGSRFIPGGIAKNTPLLRWLAIRLLHAPLTSLASNYRWSDTTNGFRAYSRALLVDQRVQPFRSVFLHYELHTYLMVQAGRLGLNLKEVPVERRYPKHQVPTKISPIRGNLRMLRTLINACSLRYNPISKR